MGYGDHQGAAPAPVAEREPDIFDRAGTVIGLVVRLIGVALLCVGIAVALKVISEAFQLYNQPQVIERFAQAIDQGSNLDAVLAPDPTETSGAATSADSRTTQAPLRLSYFAAWVVVLMLLVVVSGIAMSVVATGGKLALGDLSLRKRR